MSGPEANGNESRERVARLEEVLRGVQWQTISGGQGSSAYPTCVGCGVQSFGTLSTEPHATDCPIDNVLRGTPVEPADFERYPIVDPAGTK